MSLPQFYDCATASRGVLRLETVAEPLRRQPLVNGSSESACPNAMDNEDRGQGSVAHDQPINGIKSSFRALASHINRVVGRLDSQPL